jgi:hypothetical protein
MIWLMGVSAAVEGVYGQDYSFSYAIDSVETPLPGRDYYRRGYNRLSVPPEHVPPVESAGETIDSVTVGGVLKYFVMPDSAINYSWYTPEGEIIDLFDTLHLVTSFRWSITHEGTGADENRHILYHPTLAITSAAQKTPFHSVQWNSLNVGGDADTLYVASAFYGCGGQNASLCCIGDLLATPVRVIGKPWATFDTTAGAFNRIVCMKTGTDTLITIPMYAASPDMNGDKRLQVAYSISKNSVMLDRDTVPASATGVAEITYRFAAYGVYRLEIEDVTDRISRKSNVHGTSPFKSSHSHVFDVIIAPPPKLSPPYRIPNRKKN